jgi:hypothetical protein
VLGGRGEYEVRRQGLLVTERGWTGTQFANWLSASLTAALLPPEPGRPTA